MPDPTPAPPASDPVVTLPTDPVIAPPATDPKPYPGGGDPDAAAAESD